MYYKAFGQSTGGLVFIVCFAKVVGCVKDESFCACFIEENAKFARQVFFLHCLIEIDNALILEIDRDELGHKLSVNNYEEVIRSVYKVFGFYPTFIERY